MSETKAVVIGGCCDGTLCTADIPYREGRRTKRNSVFGFTDPNEPVEIERSHYRLEYLRSGERRFPVYIEIHMAHDEAVERILGRYVRPN